MGAPEAYVEKYLLKLCKEKGFICWKFTSQGTAGVPDRVVIANGDTYFIELKRPGGKPRPLQVKRIEEIRKQGVFACVIDTRAMCDEFIAWISGEADIPEWAKEC